MRSGGIKLAYSKVLELAARYLGIGIKRRSEIFSGHKLTVVFPEPTSLAVSRYSFYEEGLTRMVLENVKPGMTFLDVGAHIGYFTLLGSWLVGSGGQVHSFEPTPSTFEVLRLNTGQIHNVFLNQFAVGFGAGTATLNDYGPAFSGYNSMYRARMSEEALGRVKVTQFQASVIPIDDYVVQEKLRPSFIKIDAESAEFDILMGMEQTLNSCRPTVSVEVGDMDIEGVIPCRDLVQYLVNKGYRAYEFDGDAIVEHQLRERYEYDNILFLPGN